MEDALDLRLAELSLTERQERLPEFGWSKMPVVIVVEGSQILLVRLARKLALEGLYDEL
jgi:hypothetical protein